jgi:hypothetical protein
MDLPYTRENRFAVGAMRLQGQSDDQLDMRLSVDELVLLKNVLHEVCNGMHFTDGDFHTIFGANRGEIEGLLRHANGVLTHLRLIAE